MSEKSQDKEKIEKKKRRVRSPNYPNYDLKECMDFLAKFFKKYSTTEAYYDYAVKAMGHSPTSSTANRVVASMLSFGLLDSRGIRDDRWFQLSELAKQILSEEENSQQWIALLKKAALNDSAMQSIWEKWEHRLPAEENIEKELVLNKGFSHEGAKRFASVIKATYDYAMLYEPSTPEETREESHEDIHEESSEPSIDSEPISFEPIESKPKANSGNHVQNYNEMLPSSVRKANYLLPGNNREVLIHAPSDLTDEEFERVIQWLQLQKYGLVTKGKSHK